MRPNKLAPGRSNSRTYYSSRDKFSKSLLEPANASLAINMISVIILVLRKHKGKYDFHSETDLYEAIKRSTTYNPSATSHESALASDSLRNRNGNRRR